jgi:DNA-binding protein H-NS
MGIEHGAAQRTQKDLTMARMNGLDKMSYADLSALRDRIDAAMIEAKVAEKSALRAKIEAIAAQGGYRVAELVDGRRGRKSKSLKGSKVAAKFRNPKDLSQTWAGRGRQPLWLVAALRRGQKIESFRV